MADNFIQVEYNMDLELLEQLLSGVHRAGDFLASGTVEVPMPKLEVEGVGVVSFPVPSSQIAALIEQATRAPYGRGEATLLDESVRKVWQLSPNKVRLSGKSWAIHFEGILRQVSAGLGCQEMAVRAEFYKLLVYDEGGFFLAHRDTEKTVGMFGTLVLTLPSTHRGGELVVRHAGREIVVDLSKTDVSEIGFAAFYADCEHEVRPITAGNRVCLVYNLLLERAVKGRSQSLQAPDYEKQITAAAKLLKENLSRQNSPAKVAWLLAHQYSPDGLTFAALKSSDAARAQVLVQAAERAGCAAHLGIVHIEESGAAEPSYYDYRPRRNRYRDEDDTDSEEADDEFAVIEVCDSRHYVSQWRDLRDRPVEFGEIPLAPGELLPAGALDDEKPDHQRLMEASGNEGASFERSYHRAALVIWRRERYAEVLLQAGVAAVLPYLKECIDAAATENAPSSAQKNAVRLARQLVNAWKEAPQYRSFVHPERVPQRPVMLGLLQQLGEATLWKEFVVDVTTRDYDGSENAALVAGAGLLDSHTVGPVFTNLIHRKMGDQPGRCVDLLEGLDSRWRAAGKNECQDALRQIAEAAVNKLDDVGKKKAGGEWSDWLVRDDDSPVDAGWVEKLLNVLGNLKAPELRISAVNKFACRTEVFDPVTILTPALAKIRQWDAGLWEHTVEFLLRRSGEPPAAPRDWCQIVKLDCACPDCRELQAFVLDPARQTHRFRVRKDRRQHLHQQIEHHHLDMAHETERHGSPQTLVCVKDRRSYQRQCDQYRKDIAALARLAALASKFSAENAALMKRIAAARSVASKWSPA